MMKKLKENFLAIAITCVIVLLFSVVLINQAKADANDMDLTDKEKGEAFYNVGWGYESKSDYNQAVKWYIKSAELGEVKGQVGLCRQYFRALDFNDYKNSYKYCNDALNNESLLEYFTDDDVIFIKNLRDVSFLMMKKEVNDG